MSVKKTAERPAWLERERYDLRKVEAFLRYEANLLDERRFEEWMELFTEDGFYWAPARADQESPHHEVSLFFDDRDAMRMRIRRLRHPQIHAQTPASVMSRIVGSEFVEQVDGASNTVTVRSKFVICEWRSSVPDGEYRVFGGTFWHQLVEHGNDFRIAMKKAVLVNCDARQSPLYVYF